MVKILMGLAAVVVIAVGGFFGFEFYTQHRITSEVEAAFAQIRAGGGKASHGKVSFDLKSRTLRIDDIATEIGDAAAREREDRQLSRRQVSASRMRRGFRPTASKHPASRSASALLVRPDGQRHLQDAANRHEGLFRPREHAGASPLRHPSSRPIDPRWSSLPPSPRLRSTAPTIAGTINNFGAAMSGDFNYSGIALRDIKGGKIASLQVERNAFTANTQQAGKADKIDRRNGQSRLARFRCRRACRHPRSAKGERRPLLPRLRQDDCRALYVTSAQGLRVRIDGMTLDDVGVRPSRLQLPTLLALMQAAGATPTPAQAREMIDKVATIYEGMRIGTAEMRGISAEHTARPVQARRRSGSTWKTARSASLRSKGSIQALAERARQARTLRAQIARYRQSACEWRRNSRTRRQQPSPD